uniref:Biotin--[acetyl-CoA-carboxylase] ligase n=1 Tax=Roseihalotalea indica TaxID=2867963 RepID=A0AA49GR29_9BACT|nr:biotin--[acetyl-CoA-carboxylase] ligase [Tunicatimonas sp. TK19036]
MESFSFTTAQLGKQLFYYESCDSTNRVAAQLLQENKAQPGAVVVADFQTAGRGQQHHQWESAAGDNLTFSVILSPKLSVHQQFLLNIIVSLAVAEALKPLLKDEIQVKWPNDIFYQDSKLGGILIQNNLQSAVIRTSVVGIGLNVNQTQFSFPRAISLAMIRHQVMNLQEILNAILLALEHQLQSNPVANSSKLRGLYEARLYGRGKERTFKDKSGLLKGTIQGVEENGSLRIKVNGQIRHYNFHEIQFCWSQDGC